VVVWSSAPDRVTGELIVLPVPGPIAVSNERENGEGYRKKGKEGRKRRGWEE